MKHKNRNIGSHNDSTCLLTREGFGLLVFKFRLRFFNSR